MDYQSQENAGLSTPASGGVKPPSMREMMAMYPEDTPNLLDATNRPNEPITAGLSSGPGPGPEALDPRVGEIRQLKTFLPLIEPFLDREDTPNSVRALVKYIKGS
jgi:hypothetical protein